MDRKLLELTADRIADTQEWLRRALVNAKSARVLVEKDDPELLVEAVTQVQQACEKATKAVMLAQGLPYTEVRDMRHNTIGAFVNLIARMMRSNSLAGDVSKVPLTQNAIESANALTKMVFSGKPNKAIRDKVMYAWKQVLPDNAGDLGNRALEVEQWQRLTRAFPPIVVEIFVDFHDGFGDMWRQYVNEVPNLYADPRPVLDGEVKVETWVFCPAYAGLPRQFPGQERDAQVNPVLANLAQQLLSDMMEQMFRDVDRRNWPDAINVREVLLHISRWLTSLGWLFLCATVTTPHAVSSRYPAQEFESKTVKGSQHYTTQLGVVACIGPLAIHTEDAIRNLIRHYRDIGNGYRQMIR